MKGISSAVTPILLASVIILVLSIQPVKTGFSAHTSTNSSFSEQQVLTLVNGSRAYEYDLELENIALRHRAFRSGGSAGANETAYWIRAQFENFGLETWLEPFQFTNWTLLSEPLLMIDDDRNQSTTHDQTVINSFQSTHLSWPTPEGGVFADLMVLPLPKASDVSEIGILPIHEAEWDAIDTTGKIVLVGGEVRWDHNWELIYNTKLSEQTPAAVIYTWWYDWMSFTPPVIFSAGGRPISSFGPYYWNLAIPVGFVNYEEGLWIRNRENTANIAAYTSIKSVIGAGTHYNVIGKIAGYENPETMVIISAHYDTVMCSGFCDNGAGTAGVIELARVFADAVKNDLYRPRYTLLFAAFGDEELGLIGSINYVTQHKPEMPNITAVINLDSIGSDDFYVTETDPSNGLDLDEVVFDAAQELGIDAILWTPGGSDQETFRSPSWANGYYLWSWGLEADISDAAPVEASAMLFSVPTSYRHKWTMGTPGWIHTIFDNSTSTETLNWVEAEDLANHVKVAALSIMHITPHSTVSRYLDVHVIDSIGQDVPSANVTATCPNTAVADSNLTDAGGWARLTLTEGILYTIKASYEIHSASTAVNMTDNKQINLMLEDFIIPEFPSFLIPLMLIITTLTAVVAKASKRFSPFS